jgi:hypothetical protein
MLVNTTQQPKKLQAKRRLFDFLADVDLPCETAIIQSRSHLSKFWNSGVTKC